MDRLETRIADPDHGGGIDAACARWGGSRADWLDLSTGINPRPYPVPTLPPDAWTALPDRAAFAALEQAARRFWAIPDGAALIAAPGASALIARIPALLPPGQVAIPAPTYNEHARAFRACGWTVTDDATEATVIVHPNNPDGRLHPAPAAPFTVIDESFCDVTPHATHIAQATRPGTLILKSFGKFWGLAGARLGFAIGDPALIDRLKPMIGPWAVPGPTLAIATAALNDPAWAVTTRARLATDSQRLDALMVSAGLTALGGTTLFRLYDTPDAALWQDRLARHHILSRIFPYSTRWLRLGLPDGDGWPRLEHALT
ncbi:MAG: pyridoxal phosphate-dependent class II aminotransferase [Rhodobacteraceae bacterium]|nr:pyridoxal phosphate-dependent class II aminotransferase [Paracoccaceae bacterium]